jgi:hypothetical protein
MLLDKLEFYSVSGTVHKLIKSYLDGRFQRVTLLSKYLNLTAHSEWGMIPHGVPQGSMLGLFLFFIYINNFPVI